MWEIVYIYISVYIYSLEFFRSFQLLHLNSVDLWDVVEQHMHNMKVQQKNLQELQVMSTWSMNLKGMWTPCHEDLKLIFQSNTLY